MMHILKSVVKSNNDTRKFNVFWKENTFLKSLCFQIDWYEWLQHLSSKVVQTSKKSPCLCFVYKPCSELPSRGAKSSPEHYFPDFTIWKKMRKKSCKENSSMEEQKVWLSLQYYSSFSLSEQTGVFVWGSTELLHFQDQHSCVTRWLHSVLARSTEVCLWFS